MNWAESISQWLTDSSIREWVLHLLMNVPGLPPIVQAIHITAIAVVIASIGFVALRHLGLAVPSQLPQEMLPRLMPWTWWALLTLFLSGMVFVIARPDRYFSNPIAGWKLVLLLPTFLTALWLQWPVRSQPDYWQQTRARQRVAQVFAAIILLLLIGIIFAGRWIAYTDYLYWE